MCRINTSWERFQGAVPTVQMFRQPRCSRMDHTVHEDLRHVGAEQTGRVAEDGREGDTGCQMLMQHHCLAGSLCHLCSPSALTRPRCPFGLCCRICFDILSPATLTE
jgi:hypothetical protein